MGTNNKQLAIKCYKIDIKNLESQIQTKDRFIDFCLNQLKQTNNDELKRYINDNIHEAKIDKRKLMNKLEHIKSFITVLEG